MSNEVRQAIVIVHGMGEQRPLETLKGFIDAALPGPPSELHSRPDKVTDSYEARRYLAERKPKNRNAQEIYAQTEVYEFHWAHMMQGNRLDDMWSTFRRVLFALPNQVPSGLRVVWALFWLGVALTVWAFWAGPLSDLGLLDVTGDEGIARVIRTLIGSSLITSALIYVITKMLPSWMTKNFVDVVRYLDTSARSYDARRNIRKGMVELLDGLHKAKDSDGDPRYQRIILVAHSLGAYIAYDGIAYLWTRMNKLHAGAHKQEPPPPPDPSNTPDGLAELEAAAQVLLDAEQMGRKATTQQVKTYREAQRNLWLGLRKNGNPWIITDFVTAGTPMYMADRIYTKNEKEFRERASLTELPRCPPVSDDASGEPLKYTWKNGSRKVLYHGAPFAVVRWTNVWFPPALGFFGDWFGGPLARLYGYGIQDVPLKGNKPKQLIPAWAHTLYFDFPEDEGADSVTGVLQEAFDLASSEWLAPTLQAPAPNPETAQGTGRAG